LRLADVTRRIPVAFQGDGAGADELAWGQRDMWLTMARGRGLDVETGFFFTGRCASGRERSVPSPSTDLIRAALPRTALSWPAVRADPFEPLLRGMEDVAVTAATVREEES